VDEELQANHGECGQGYALLRDSNIMDSMIRGLTNKS
jgi:hypothetical protein